MTTADLSERDSYRRNNNSNNGKQQYSNSKRNTPYQRNNSNSNTNASSTSVPYYDEAHLPVERRLYSSSRGQYSDDNRSLRDEEDEDERVHGGGRGYSKLESGKIRTLPQNKILAFCVIHRAWLVPVALTLLAFWTRLYRITQSNIVVWDEAHFGKFASHYLKRDFYFDVHPPLGKILVAFGGLLAGYNGRFEFKSGEKYPEDLHYGVMRVYLALFGIAMVPLAYGTAKELGFSRRGAFLAGWLVLLDTAYMAISRFILLDSMLLCFTCLTLYCLTCFHNERQKPFSVDWWMWLLFTGVSIGLVTSVKWVGFFATALVGLYTIEELWNLFGDLSIPKPVYVKHWIARIGCLIAVPAVIYLFSFYLHFLILNMSGPGDAQMSSLFQAGLQGNTFHENPVKMAYYSKLTMKNNGYGGGLLHSHVQAYPEGSTQQQVTCYHHKDDNNHWVVYPIHQSELKETDDVKFVQNGDIIRLIHAGTGRNLHSHSVKAPMTSGANEVSCYGNDTIGDANDHWKVEVVDDLFEGKIDHVKSLTTRIRLRHVPLGCLLRSHNTNLPQWGFKQAEVVCEKGNHTDSINNMWNIEQHWNPKLPAGDKTVYKSKFLKDFWDLNVAMMTSNNALVPDPDKEDALTSHPGQWPFALVGLRMCSWADDTIKFYLLGNPVVWWSSAAALLVFVGTLAVYAVRMQRQYKDFQKDEWYQFTYVGKVLSVGWLLHYLPFCIMGRVTYLHHYFPALYFAILMVPFLMDHFVRRFRLSRRAENAVYGTAAAVTLLVFLHFSPIAFGIDRPIAQFKGRSWLESWTIENK